MKKALLNKVNPLSTIAFSALLFLISGANVQAKGLYSVPDSIGMEVQDGKQIVIHRLNPKETYYGLSQRYKVPLQDLITFNGNKPLKMGETIRIPTQRPAITEAAAAVPAVTPTPTPAPANQEEAPLEPEIHLNPGEFTAYNVGRGETLFSVSKRFGVSIEMIKRTNALVDDQLPLGMQLHVPHKAVVERIEQEERLAAREPSPDIGVFIGEQPSEQEVEFEVRKNRYGIREVNEKGVGVWIDDLNQDGGSMLVLHKTAPVGTIIKITNPMTHHSTFAKVVGKYTDTAQTQGSIIVISSSVASAIGILDRRFQIEIAYGAPLDEVVRR